MANKKHLPNTVTHSKARTLRLFRNYNGTNFFGDYENEYIHAYRSGYFPELQKALQERKRITKQNKIRKTEVLAKARKYKGTDFRKEFIKDYTHAVRNRYLTLLKTLLAKRSIVNSDKNNKHWEKIIIKVPQDQYKLTLAHVSKLNFVKIQGESKREAGKQPKALSRTETEILNLIMKGLTNNEISRKLKKSKRTIDSHRYNIMQKIRVSSMLGLVKYAFKNGLIGF